MRTTLMSLVTAAVIGIAAAAYAATCPPNPAGGPNDLLLTSTGVDSDLDLGWKRGYSNIKVPRGSTFHTCLTACDPDTNPVCNADGAGVTTLGDAFSPPVPIYGGNPATTVCVVVKFKTPPNGTANIQTGEIDMKVGLSAQAYLNAPADNICPRCSGATIGAAGTCDTGARAGQACVTDDVAHVIGFQTNNPDYTVSRDCLPAGAPSAAVDIANIPVTTKQASLTGSPPCPGQAQDDDCGTNNNVHRPCTSTVCTGAALNGGGVPQYCCTGATSRACFPTAADATGLGSIVRDGSTSPPTPLWPNPGDERDGAATLVTAFCVPTTGNILYDIGVGVPGPLAMIVPLTHKWSTTAVAATTTTTSTLAPTTSSTIVAATTSTTLAPVTTSTVVTATTTTSTTIPGCTSPADCDDGNACTNDVCSVHVCGHSDVHSFDCATTDLGALQQAGICGSETIDPKLAKKIAAAVTKADNFLAKAKAATKPAKAAKLANKASNVLKALQKQVAKAVNAKKNPISAGCSSTITSAAQRVRQVIADTISP